MKKVAPLCAQCKAERGVLRVRDANEGTYMLEKGETFRLDTGAYIGLSRGSEYLGTHWERVRLTRAEPHLCQACRPKAKRPRARRREQAGQATLPLGARS